MKNQSVLFTVSKRTIFTGIAIAFTWQILQTSFFINNWATPGQTSLFLFFLQIISAIIFLSLSFNSFQNLTNYHFSFWKYLQIGFLTGIIVAFFSLLFFLLYTNILNPNYESWLNEMYLQSWIKKGLTDHEIQQQKFTNAWLKTPRGIIYSVFFISSLTFIISIIPAAWYSKHNI